MVKLLKQICVGICVNIILWELIVRLLLSSPCTQLYDAELGYVNVPGARYVESIEGYSQTRFNTIGFNDEEPMWKQKVSRILIVGDSYTEGFQVGKKRAMCKSQKIT